MRIWGFGGQSRPVDRRLARALGLSGERAIEVVRVEPGTPAAVAGLKAADLIISADALPVETVDDVHRTLGPDAIGRPPKIAFAREGHRLEAIVTPREAP